MKNNTKKYQRPQVKSLGLWDKVTLQVHSVPVDPNNPGGVSKLRLPRLNGGKQDV